MERGAQTMVRTRQQALDGSSASAAARYALRAALYPSNPASMVTDGVRIIRSAPNVGHPGFEESLIPFWGSGRETVADLQDGDYLGAALNAGLTASDVFLAGSVGKALGKAAIKVAAESAAKGSIKKAVQNSVYFPKNRTWPTTRKKMGKQGLLKANQDGHHWLIPQKGWGKSVPDWVRNNPLNIMGMPSKLVHGRLSHRVGDLPRFTPLEKFIHGTPPWAKIAGGSVVGHPVGAAKAQADRRR